jgi:electron transfer flavoprotein alpha subunit
MSEIWAISEKTAALLELVAHAKRLAKDEKVIAFAFSPEEAETVASHGADKVIHLQGEGRPEVWVDKIIEQANSVKPSAILWGTSKRAKEMAARVSAALNTGLITECFKIDRIEEFETQRYIYGGLCISTDSMSSQPFMATVSAKTIETLPEGEKAEIEVLTGANEVYRIKELRQSQASSNLGETGVVVCVGRGMAKKEDIDLARRLAKALGGEVGCTRPVAEDLDWMPEEYYIGISGQVVKPSLYFGIGVSGQIQHVSGIRDSKLVVAIEKNENAPILEAADYILLGDLYEILPALLKALSA